MRKFILDKVVRARIPDLMDEAGSVVEKREVHGPEAVRALLRKAIEELQEAIDAPPEELVGEFADAQTALKDAITASGIPASAVDEQEARRAAKHGRFIPTIEVITVNVQDEDPMAEYYASNPTRFPEVHE
ncbi:MAG: hypothetical protein JWN82_305 [Candidatus Saccharibacteria bacterium]|nr:hypothetical protein [Candidatus Saccharibacteria bacterium]